MDFDVTWLKNEGTETFLCWIADQAAFCVRIHDVTVMCCTKRCDQPFSLRVQLARNRHLMKMSSGRAQHGIANDSLVPPRSASNSYDVWSASIYCHSSSTLPGSTNLGSESVTERIREHSFGTEVHSYFSPQLE